MKMLDRAACRAAAVAYGIRGAIGALTGAFLGYCGALRDAHDRATAPRTAMFVATIGFLAGLIFWRLRRMRERGGVYYYFSWGLSVAGGTALALLPRAFKTGEWLEFVVLVAFAIPCGFGLTAFVVMAAMEDDRD